MPADRVTERAILAVLAGTPLGQAAALVPAEPARLADAIDLYLAAGRLALDTRARCGSWHQVHLEFPDWHGAELTAASHLWPLLQQAEQAGLISSWWFMRKHPCWRFRFQPGQAATLREVKTYLARALGTMQSQGLLADATETIYEPEAHAFGGPDGIDIAHRLFHADSRSILGYLREHDSGASAARQTIGRRELSVLLCTQMMRGAGQDWYEQGDIWHRVTHMRPLQPGGDPRSPQASRLATAVRQLITANPVVSGSALAFAAPWFAAFSQAGRAIASAGQAGEMERGTRSILAHLVIFHWNRLGLTTQTQAILSRALRDTIMHVNRAPARHTRTRVL